LPLVVHFEMIDSPPVGLEALPYVFDPPFVALLGERERYLGWRHTCSAESSSPVGLQTHADRFVMRSAQSAICNCTSYPLTDLFLTAANALS
jgi:hypothetical protein